MLGIFFLFLRARNYARPSKIYKDCHCPIVAKSTRAVSTSKTSRLHAIRTKGDADCALRYRTLSPTKRAPNAMTPATTEKHTRISSPISVRWNTSKRARKGTKRNHSIVCGPRGTNKPRKFTNTLPEAPVPVGPSIKCEGDHPNPNNTATQYTHVRARYQKANDVYRLLFICVLYYYPAKRRNFWERPLYTILDILGSFCYHKVVSVGASPVQLTS